MVLNVGFNWGVLLSLDEVIVNRKGQCVVLIEIGIGIGRRQIGFNLLKSKWSRVEFGRNVWSRFTPVRLSPDFTQT